MCQYVRSRRPAGYDSRAASHQFALLDASGAAETKARRGTAATGLSNERDLTAPGRERHKPDNEDFTV
jgi:hypothetical protein